MLAPRLRDLTVKQFWDLLGPYVTLIFTGFILGFFPASFPWHESIMRLSDALLIAGILAVGIELFSHNRLLQRVADELAGRLVGNGLPGELQKQIGELTQVKLVRSDYRKIYRFGAPHDGKVAIWVTISFTVLNYGNKDEEYTPWIGEESFYDPKFLSLEYYLHSGKSFCCNEMQLEGRRTIREKTHAIEVKGDPITIPRLRDDPNAKCNVVWRYKVTMPEEYSDISSFSLPATGLTIELEDLPEGFEFFAGANAEHLAGSKTWIFKRSFIDGQHVRTWWFRKKTSQEMSVLK